MRPLFFYWSIAIFILATGWIVYLIFENQKLQEKLSTVNQPKQTETKLPIQKEDKPYL